MDRLTKLIETVLDFDAARRARADKAATPAPTEHEKYLGALGAQKFGKDLDTSTPFGSAIADFMRDAITTMAQGQELSAAQRQRARDFLDVSYHANKVTTHHAVSEIVDLYNKENPSSKVSLSYTSKRMAYEYEDDDYLTNRIVSWGKRKLIFQSDNELELYKYVFDHYLPKIKHLVEDKKLMEWFSSMEKMAERLSDTHRIPEKDAPFDPRHRDEYSMTGYSPYVFRLLNRWSKRADGGFAGTIQADNFGNPPELKLIPRFGNPGVKRFKDSREMSDYIDANETQLQRWYDRQQTREAPADAAIIRAIKPIIQKGYDAIQKGEEAPAAMTSYETRELIDSLKNKKLSTFLRDIVRDLNIPTLGQFFDQAHKEWVMSAIDRLAAGKEMYE